MKLLKCYLCKSSLTPFLFKNNYQILKCGNCGLLQTDLKRDYATFVKEYYGKGYFSGDPNFCAYDEYDRDKSFILLNLRKMLGRIEKYKTGGKLLDAGCAMGHLIDFASENGWNSYGFDPSGYALSHVPKRLQNKVKEGTIDTVSYKPKSFDVITLLDVAEHLNDPIKNFKKIRGFLKDSGYIIIATGDIDSLAARIFGKRWTFYNPPQHLFFYSKKTLSEVLNQSGFEPIEWFTLGKWLSLGYTLHLARSVAGSNLANHLYKAVKALGLSKLPLYIPMNDNMVVIARKN